MVVLETAECKTLARLIIANGVLQTFQSMAANGLTIFAPIGKSSLPTPALGCDVSKSSTCFGSKSSV